MYVHIWYTATVYTLEYVICCLHPENLFTFLFSLAFLYFIVWLFFRCSFAHFTLLDTCFVKGLAYASKNDTHTTIPSACIATHRSLAPHRSAITRRRDAPHAIITVPYEGECWYTICKCKMCGYVYVKAIWITWSWLFSVHSLYLTIIYRELD